MEKRNNITLGKKRDITVKSKNFSFYFKKQINFKFVGTY